MTGSACSATLLWASLLAMIPASRRVTAALEQRLLGEEKKLGFGSTANGAGLVR